LPKLTGAANDWRIRVGEYRIVYEIDDKAQIILVNRVRHRREVYRR
jgi:mRNA interferase RelE/StbE